MNTVSEKVRKINRTLFISIIYILLTLISSALGLMVGSVQFRLSEILCVLPMYTPLAIPGLAIGCFFSSIVQGGVFLDIVLSTVATTLGAVGTWFFRDDRWTALLWPIFAHMLIVPCILQNVYHVHGSYLGLMFMVFIGEFVCTYVLGQMFIDFLVGDIKLDTKR